MVGHRVDSRDCTNDPLAAVLTERIRTITLADGTAGAIVKPPLKWAGGKRWQIPHLEPLWASHRHRRLVEPFCGGLAVTLGLGPERALLNDLNPHLIHFYRRVQEGLTITIPLENDAEAFYGHRHRFKRATGRRSRVEHGSRIALLLSEPNRLQRTLPIQSTWPVQRAVWSPRDDQLRSRLLGLPARALELVVYQH